MTYTIDNVLADALKVATDMAHVQQTTQILEELGGSIQEVAKRLDEAQKREDEQ